MTSPATSSSFRLPSPCRTDGVRAGERPLAAGPEARCCPPLPALPATTCARSGRRRRTSPFACDSLTFWLRAVTKQLPVLTARGPGLPPQGSGPPEPQDRSLTAGSGCPTCDVEAAFAPSRPWSPITSELGVVLVAAVGAQPPEGLPSPSPECSGRQPRRLVARRAPWRQRR